MCCCFIVISNESIMQLESIKIIATNTIIQKIKDEFKLQGHSLSGAFEQSLRVIVEKTPEGFSLIGRGNHYGGILNSGVEAQKIPYSGKTGRGGTSLYIEALRKFVEARGMASGKEALSIAFAIAAKQKKEGLPTNASKRFSKTNKRTQFVQEGMKKSLPDFKAQLSNLMKKEIVDSLKKGTK